MRLKEHERSRPFMFLKKAGNFFGKFFSNRKLWIILFALILILIFFLGIFTGLLATGFLGTLDKPSQKALDIMHSFGIQGLGSLKAKISDVLSENVHIPLNYIRGQFSMPKKMYVDIGFEQYQKIEYKRDQALQRGQLITAPDDYVPAKISVDDKSVKVKLRLKGDMVDHFNGDKWSFRIKVTEDNEAVWGMKVFSVQDPETRRGINEPIHFEMLKREGILVPRYEFVEVYINGVNKGIYALEEHFEKQLIENDEARAGVIIKFNEDPSWEETFQKKDLFSSVLEMDNFRDSQYLGWFYASNIDTFDEEKIYEDPVLSKEFIEARNLLESFRKGSLETHDVFDVDKLAKYFALEALNGCGHGSRWSNVRYYYNPITSLLEPIGFDGDCWKSSDLVMDKYFIPEEDAIENYHLFFNDHLLVEKYVQELEKISNKSYLDNFFSDFGGQISEDISIIHKDNPLAHFSPGRFYSNQQIINSTLNPVKSVNAYFQNVFPDKRKIELYVANLENLPLEIRSVSYNDTVFELYQGETALAARRPADLLDHQKFVFLVPSGFVWHDEFSKSLKLNYNILGSEINKQEVVYIWPYLEDDFLEQDFIRKKTDINSFDLIQVDEEQKEVKIKTGSFSLNESLIIPPGYSVTCEPGTLIDLVNNAMILSYSNVQFMGLEASPIKIISSDGTGQGLTVMNADGESHVVHTIFANLTSPEKGDWNLMGALNVYESPIQFDNVLITGSHSEDGLNIINSNYSIIDTVIENSDFDCFDSDFSKGVVKNSVFLNCGNDGLDFGGSTAEVTNVHVYNVGDKGLSAGEKSKITIDSIFIEGIKGNETNIAISSKDSANIFLDNAVISNANYALAVYQKKPEFGPAIMKASHIELEDVRQESLIEEKSSLELDGQTIEGKEKEVYKRLYGSE